MSIGGGSQQTSGAHAWEDEIRDILSARECAVWSWDLRRNELRVSDAAYRMLGYERGEVTPGFDLWKKLLHPDDAGFAVASFRRHYEGDPQPLLVLVRMRTRQGTWAPILFRGEIVRRDANGRPERMVGMQIDLRAMRSGDDDRARLAAILEATPDFVSTATAGGRILYMNRAGRRMIGIEDDADLSNMLIADVHPEDALAAVLSTAVPAAIARGPYEHETWLRRRDGTRVPVSQVVMAHRGANGDVEYLSTVARDISDRRRAQQEARESEEKFRLIIQSLPMGMLLYRLREDGALVFEGANPEADRVLLQDHRRFIGKTLEEVFPPLADTEIPNHYRRAAAEGVTWRTQEVSYKDERIGGAFEVVAFQTAPRHMAAAFIEITERLRSHAALRRSEEKHRRLFETMAQGVLHLDDEGRILLSNPAASRILGLPPDRLRGREAFDDRWLPTRRDGSDFWIEEQPTTRARGSSAPQHAVLGVVNPGDGQRRWLEVTAVRAGATDNVEAPAVYVTLLDMTERVQAEQERERLEAQLLHSQKMQAVGRLAGGIAHDFNNILTAIQGYADLIRRRLPPDDPIAADVEQISRAGQRAAALTQQLLAFSRKQPIQPRPVDINRQVENARSMLQRLIGEHIDLSLQLTEGLGLVLADPNQIDQVLLNLSVNARDAMPSGGKLLFETRDVMLEPEQCLGYPELVPGEFVLLSVSDTGSGMDEPVLRQAFEPFFTTKAPGEGTGLGLSTVYGIVRQNGGMVQLRSKPGLGTTVNIYLPRADSATAAPSAPSPAEATGGRETILVVEDEEIVRDLAVRVLDLLGYRVLAANDGEDAERLCREHEGRVDLLLSDVVMPGMNGKELRARLSALQPRMRVLFMSGYSENIFAHRGLIDPGVPFLQKPFSVASLARKVRDVLDKEG